MKRIFVLLVVLLSMSFSKSSFELGMEYTEKEDYKQAAELFKKACDGGDVAGCAFLGILYQEGKGVKQDYKKAAELWEKACDGSNAFSCTLLGILYQEGKGVKQNLSAAKQYHGKACDLGFQLGCDRFRKLNEKGY